MTTRSRPPRPYGWQVPKRGQFWGTVYVVDPVTGEVVDQFEWWCRVPPPGYPGPLLYTASEVPPEVLYARPSHRA